MKKPQQLDEIVKGFRSALDMPPEIEAPRPVAEERETKSKIAAELIYRANVAEAKAARMAEALKKARVWHEFEEKALSKQPPSYGPNGNVWARSEHKEKMAEIDAALQSEGLS
jgi:hypothetical protein